MFVTEGGRVEAFSDGVIAVILTIMVLELKAPHGTDLASLREALPTFAAYVLSFILVAIYWNNHHHMLRASIGVNGAAMWANLHLLFWLSLVPFATSWAGAYPNAATPTALYGVVQIMASLAYAILQRTLMRLNGEDGAFARAVRQDAKGYGSVALFIVGTGLAFVRPALGDAFFVATAVLWLIPDRRFEPVIASRRRDG